VYFHFYKKFYYTSRKSNAIEVEKALFYAVKINENRQSNGFIFKAQKWGSIA